ncbi:ubiquitin carboxyl-terminal hydrolase [Thelonectria olida]|uniref:Ubiquitin carboxyl-terminal hydrolase n=1 Tax=Thelonectria olida TaxID=1576542 RepID=A0A9P8W6T0_9HYPO|nr:ubiquitin carboxyl-terminal hydrolase [Thelonectria olida]
MADNAQEPSSPPKKIYTMLENNPEVMNELAQKLGLSSDLAFYDVYSLDDPDLLAMIPRPVHALLVIIPLTDAWDAVRRAEAEKTEWYEGSGPDETVLWIRQTIIHGCGLIGFLHCALNGVPAESVIEGSPLAEFRDQIIPLKMDDRAQFLFDSQVMYDASQSVAVKGDTAPPTIDEMEKIGEHFVAFVRGNDGNLWEMEGARKGPLNRGALSPENDLLSKEALELGFKKVIDLQESAGEDIRFSCIALAKREA